MKIHHDKVLHFAAGVVAGFLTIICVEFFLLYDLPWTVFFVGCLVGIGYECLQAYRKEGVPTGTDALATILGSGIVALGLWVFLP